MYTVTGRKFTHPLRSIQYELSVTLTVTLAVVLMDGFLLYAFLGLFLALSLLFYANLLVLQYFNLRFRNSFDSDSGDDKRRTSLQQTLLVLSVSCLWYFISLSFTLYNKWIMQQW
jgi:hypothetical protein